MFPHIRYVRGKLKDCRIMIKSHLKGKYLDLTIIMAGRRNVVNEVGDSPETNR